MIEAIVTGAGRGIGLETVRMLSDLEVHAIGISRNTSQLTMLKGCTAVKADLTALNELNKRLDPFLDYSKEVEHRVLIHNAGILLNRPFGDLSESEARLMVEVNFMAPLLLTQRLLPWLRSSKTAHIVFIGSMGGFQGSARYPGLAVYSASKSASASLAESLAEEFKHTNMRFNALALGAVNTEMLQEAFPDFSATTSAGSMGAYICDFALRGHLLFNGKVIPVAGSNP
jgi:NAD(P)-dependent dehydrogenase (short-subunit alcohol dehydrogenase family)